MRLTVASYNIHRAIGLDRRRSPERVLSVLHEISADIVALQEADRRFGRRVSVLPLQMIDDHSDYRAVALDTRPDSIGWHGNALLVKAHVHVAASGVIPLPTLEPRGAIWAELAVGQQPIRVVGMHLDLSGVRRRGQIRAIFSHIATLPPMPTILMGDLNEWSLHSGALRACPAEYQVLATGRSFHTRRPVAQLDRIIVSPHWRMHECGVHHSALAARCSDHLPVWAGLSLESAA